MSTQELSWKVSVDPAMAAAAMRSLAQEAKTSTASIEASIRHEAQSAIALQKQRSAAIVGQWRSDNAAALSLQKQRSAAIYAQWKADEREAQRTARAQAQAFVRAEAEKARAAKVAAVATERDWNNTFSTLRAGAVGVTIAATAAFAGLTQIVERAMSFDALERGLAVVAGGVERAQAQIERLREIAKMPGIGFREAIAGALNLQVAFKTVFTDIDQRAQVTEKLLKEVANAVAISGKSKAEFDRILVQMGQMASAGKVLTADLRPILQAAPAVGAALLKAFGTVNAGDIEDLGLSSKEFFKKLIVGLESLDRASESSQNSWDNFTDKLDQTMVMLGRPLLKPLITALNDLTTYIGKNENAIRENAEAFAQWARSVVPDIIEVGGALKGIGSDLISILHDLKEFGRIGNSVIFGLSEFLTGDLLLAAKHYKDALYTLGGSESATGRDPKTRLLTYPGAATDPNLKKMLDMDLGPNKSKWFTQPDAEVTRPGKKEKGTKAKEAKDELAPFKAILDQVNRALDFYGEKTEHARVAQEFLAKGIEKLNPTLRAQAELIRAVALSTADAVDARKTLATEEAKQVETAKKIAAVEGDVNEAMFLQQQVLSDLQSQFPGWLRQALDFIVAKHKEGFIWDENTRKIYLNTAAMIEQQRVLAEGATRARSVEADRRSREEFENQNLQAEGVTRPRIANPPLLSPWQEFAEGIKVALGGLGPTFATFGMAVRELGAMAIDAFSAIGQGIGNLVENWVLMGETGPDAMRKMVASVLAGVAAQSAVLAIFELAQGFAALFFNPPAAAAHFTAAALFGSVAAVTAVAGRAIAGDAFKTAATGSAGSGSRGGSGSGSNGSQSNGPTVINAERNRAPVYEIHLHGDLKALDTRVVKVVEKNINSNGGIRRLIKREK